MKKRLLLEGVDDQHVVKNLLFNHNLDDTFDLKPKDGVDNLLDTFGDELQATDLDCVAAILDADTEIASDVYKRQPHGTGAGAETVRAPACRPGRRHDCPLGTAPESNRPNIVNAARFRHRHGTIGIDRDDCRHGYRASARIRPARCERRQSWL